jgi:ubiquinone/menaquinone biosynthesis C-methylase UbiE
LTKSGENASFWAKWAPNYNDAVKNNPLFDTMVQKVVHDIGHVSKVLDVATGTGLAAFQLAASADDVQGIDLVPEMIEVAQKKAFEKNINNITFSVQGAYQLDFPDNFFDAVVILNALHTMQNPEAALSEAKRVLKPTGLLATPTPCHGQNEQTIAQLQKIHDSRFGFRDYQMFTDKSLSGLIKSCGFKEITKETAQHVMDESGFLMIITYLLAMPD